MDILENIIIGNFLFGLGAKMGADYTISPIEPLSMNLLQQTPADQVLGDVVIRNAKTFRIIEFKRTANKSHKEMSKWCMLSAGLRTESASGLLQISRKIHWYIESDFRKHRNEIGAVPYLDYPDRKVDRVEFSDFIRLTARDAACGKIDDLHTSDCVKYLELLGFVEGREGSASGCLLLFVSGDGNLGFIPTDSMRALLLTPQQIIEQTLTQQRTMKHAAVQRVKERKLERARVVEAAISRERGQSLSM
jgi:hypothetical protein